MYNSHTWERSGSWDLGQNALSQSDCRIFKSTITLEQNNEKAWFFVCLYKFIEIKGWLENIGVVVVKNGWGHSGLRTQKLAISQEGMNVINWLLMCSLKFRKAKSYFNNFGMMVTNGLSVFGLGTLKSAVSQEWIDEMS